MTQNNDITVNTILMQIDNNLLNITSISSASSVLLNNFCDPDNFINKYIHDPVAKINKRIFSPYSEKNNHVIFLSGYQHSPNGQKILFKNKFFSLSISDFIYLWENNFRQYITTVYREYAIYKKVFHSSLFNRNIFHSHKLQKLISFYHHDNGLMKKVGNEKNFLKVNTFLARVRKSVNELQLVVLAVLHTQKSQLLTTFLPKKCSLFELFICIGAICPLPYLNGKISLLKNSALENWNYLQLRSMKVVFYMNKGSFLS